MSLSSDSEDEQLLPGQQDEEWEEWDGDEEEDDATRSLFCDAVLASPEAAFEHDATHYGFDIRQFRIERHLDDYDTIRVINFIRKEVAAGRDPLPALVESGQQGSAKPWAGDEFLNPALPDDPLITYDYEEQQQLELELGQPGNIRELGACSSAEAAAAAAASGRIGAAADTTAAADQASRQVQALALENRELKLRLAALMDAALPAEVREELRQAAAEDTAAAAGAGAGPSSGAAMAMGSSSSSAAGTAAAARAAAGAPAAVSAAAAVDAQYFDSYSGFDIHHEMLSDKPRSEAYLAALTRNPRLLSGARLLDVGCGTSILCMFGAKGGAGSVVGLDGSQRIAACARQVVAANGLDAASGGPISIIGGRVEEVPGIGHDKVDVIVSEWMGYTLLFESMLDSVLAARDRWLVPGGALLPDLAAIHVAGASRQAFGTGFWQDVYGFSMQPIADELAAAAAREAQVLVRTVEPAALSTPSLQVHAMDLATMSPAQQDFTAHFTLSATSAQLAPAPAAAGAPEAAAVAEPGSSGSCSSTASEAGSTSSVEVAALVMWFDVEFSERFCKEHPVTLSTSPHKPVTHWAQALLPLAAPVSLGPGQALACRLSMARSRARHRALDISLEYSCGDVKATRIYSMEVSSSSAAGGGGK